MFMKSVLCWIAVSLDCGGGQIRCFILSIMPAYLSGNFGDKE